MKLMNKLPSYEDEDLTRVWGSSQNIKVFISHRDTYKIHAHNIKKLLERIGISSFVAHDDISPTEEWQKEILIALQSMDIFLAYISNDFFASFWTNQEVGFALGRNIPILPFKVNMDPNGFISNIQAKKYITDSFINDFIDMLINMRPLSKNLYISLFDILISNFADSYSFDTAANRFKLIEKAKTLEPHQIQAIIDAFHENGQIKGCFYLNGYKLERKINKGLICSKLNEWTGEKYEIVHRHDGLKIQKII